MSHILLVRHGRPPPSLEAYDNLSEHGREQARRLGKYWVEKGVTLNAVYTGNLKRQQETARIVKDIYQENGLSFPEIAVHSGFDEIDFMLILQELAPRIQQDDAAFRALMDQGLSAFQGKTPERLSAFEQLFKSVFKAWVEKRYHDFGYTWEGYETTVLSTLDLFRASCERDGCPAAFTSGTPIGLYIKTALELSLDVMLRVMMYLYHTNVSHFIIKKNTFFLESFNVTAHLPEAEKTVR